MSTYYNVTGVGKVRVSDHEANTRLNGSNDLALYIVDVCGNLISVESQVRSYCEKNEINEVVFEEVLKDFQDGSYAKNHFSFVKEDNNVEGVLMTKDYSEMRREAAKKGLVGITLVFGTSSSAEGRAEIKELSLATGVSQSQIKKHFNIR